MWDEILEAVQAFLDGQSIGDVIAQFATSEAIAEYVIEGTAGALFGATCAGIVLFLAPNGAGAVLGATF